MQTIITGIVIAITTSLFTYLFTRKTHKDQALLRFREEKYSELLHLLEGFVGQTASGSTKKEFFRAQHKSWLYASDEVTNAINNMIELVKSTDVNEKVKPSNDPVGEIVLAMRKDLLGKTKLTPNQFKYIDVVERRNAKK